MPGALAFRYARALADLVVKPDSGVDPQRATAELELFLNTLAETPDLKIVLESPSVAPPRKQALVGRLAEILPLSGLVRRFLCVLIDHRRTAMLAEVRDAFEATMDERLGIVRADVVSARPLNDLQRQEITITLARLTGRQTRPRFRVQDELIGGVVARIGSTVYDGSVRGQLDALRRKLAGAEG